MILKRCVVSFVRKPLKETTVDRVPQNGPSVKRELNSCPLDKTCTILHVFNEGFMYFMNLDVCNQNMYGENLFIDITER